MDKPDRLLLFVLDAHRYALPLDCVERVFPAVEVTPLPSAPQIVDGVINMRGAIVPVINIRRRFRLPEKENTFTNRLIIAHTSKRKVGLLVDSVGDVVACEEMCDAGSIVPGLDYLEGVIKIRGDVVLVRQYGYVYGGAPAMAML